MAGRNEHRDALRELLEEKLVQQSSEHWSAALREVGVPSAPINDVVGGLDFARQLGMEPTVELTREDGTSAASVAHPVKWSRSEISYRSAPPRLDENREQILRWLQG